MKVLDLTSPEILIFKQGNGSGLSRWCSKWSWAVAGSRGDVIEVRFVPSWGALDLDGDKEVLCLPFMSEGMCSWPSSEEVLCQD